MTIMIHSTDRIIDVKNMLKARVWEGTTVSGIKVHVLIPRIAAHKDEDLSQFERELKEQSAPSIEAEACFPLRMIL